MWVEWYWLALAGATFVLMALIINILLGLLRRWEVKYETLMFLYDRACAKSLEVKHDALLPDEHGR